MQFANHAFPLPVVIDSIDVAMQAVSSSLETIRATLGIIQPSQPRTESDHKQDGQTEEKTQEEKRFEKLGIAKEVLRQLKEAGFNPDALTSGELHDAALSYAYDGRVIDDPEDSTLQGKLKKTAAEIEHRADKSEFEAVDPLQPREKFASMVKRKRNAQTEIKDVSVSAEESQHKEFSFRAAIEESRDNHSPPSFDKR